MSDSIAVRRVAARYELTAFVKFPWRIYRSDPNWVPPLISERRALLDPAHGELGRTDDLALFVASRGRETLGTLAAFIDRSRIERLHRPEGGFGFFEVVEEFDVARRLLDAVVEWLRARGMTSLRGPTNFSDHESPGVLIEGADCPPVMLEAETPRYYGEFLERYGMTKEQDLYAWRADLESLGDDLERVPADVVGAAALGRTTGVALRPIRLDDWEREVSTVRSLFNDTLRDVRDSVPIGERDFRRLADQMRPFLDPDLTILAEICGRAVGFAVLIPDVNQILIRLGGRLVPFNWLMVKRYARAVDVVSFKLMGVLKEFRLRGIDALLYLESVKAARRKRFRWLDGSITTEWNPMVNLIAERLGAERYKHFRVYRMEW